MSFASGLLSGLLLLAMSAAAAGEEATDYLAKEGHLKQRLEVRDVQGGFAGFTGRFWTVEPSGAWSSGRVFNKRLDIEVKGKLTRPQLAALARELARYDLHGLPTRETGKPMANPHVVSIRFGTGAAVLTLPAGQPPRTPDPDRPRATVEGRYAGILAAVNDLLRVQKGKPLERR